MHVRHVLFEDYYIKWASTNSRYTNNMSSEAPREVPFLDFLFLFKEFISFYTVDTELLFECELRIKVKNKHASFKCLKDKIQSMLKHLVNQITKWL